MKTASRAACWLLTSTVIVATMLLLGTSRLEYCVQTEAARPCVETVAARWPTPAPPPKVVFVHVEADKSDIQIGWME